MSKITVTTIAGLTSGADANKVKIESGDTFHVTGHASVGADIVAGTRALSIAGATDGGSSEILNCFNSSLASKFSVRDDGLTTVANNAVVGGTLGVTGNTTFSGTVLQTTSSTGDIAKFVSTGHSGTGLFINSQTTDQIDLVGYDGSGANKINLRSAGATGNGVTIDTNNRVTVASDGQAQFSTIASFEVRGQQAPLCKFNHTQNADEVNLQMRHDYARGSQSATMIQFLNNNGAEKGTIKTTETATSFNTSSDYRLKENVSYDWDATSRLKQLKPCRFNWISDDTNTLVDGFLAHEVTSSVPEAITGKKDEVDGNGEIKPQGIDQSKLVPLLVKTIQELEKRISTLEGK